MDPVNRRKFLCCATIASVGAAITDTGLGDAASACAATPAVAFSVVDEQPFNAQTRRLKLMAGDRMMSALLFSTIYPTHFRLKPELYPVCTPKGFPVTDTHPYCFIHHQSIMCGHGKVGVTDRERPIDFYRKLNFPEEARSDRWHSGFNLFHKGPSGIQVITKVDWKVTDRIVIDLVLEWRERLFNSEDPGDTLMIEKRQYRVHQNANATVIDHFSHLVPAAAPVTLHADRHSFCGVRVNDLIDVEDGGTMQDSEGRTNPSGDYWDAAGDRKSPRWVDCSGEIGGSPVGVTLMGHAQNVRNEYYVREFGLMEVSATLGHDVAVTSNSPFRFAARYLAHDGPLVAGHADAACEEFSASEFPF